MKRLPILLLLLFIMTIVGCSINSSTNKSNLGKIIVNPQVRNVVNTRGESKVAIIVTNNSQKTFSGDVRVKSNDDNGKEIGFDVFHPKNLASGKSMVAGISWLKVTKPRKRSIFRCIEKQITGHG